MFCNCKCSHISVIHFVLTINYDSQLQRSEVGAALTEGFWPQGPLDKMYHSVVSWIIEQQNCNFRDQCSMPILFPGSKWAADYTHLLCFQITVWLIVWFKIISKDCKINENRLVSHVFALCGCFCTQIHESLVLQLEKYSIIRGGEDFFHYLLLLIKSVKEMHTKEVNTFCLICKTTDLLSVKQFISSEIIDLIYL